MLLGRHGNMRFGTNGDGVCRNDGTEFVYFTAQDGLGGDAIRGVPEDDDGVLWFTMNGGVSSYDTRVKPSLSSLRRMA